MNPIIPGGNDCYHEKDVPFTETLEKYGLVLLMEETSKTELEDLGSELPTDTHLVTYVTDEYMKTFGKDAVRAYKMSDIFDAYHDANLKVTAIQNGFGTIKPKLFVDQVKKDDKK